VALSTLEKRRRLWDHWSYRRHGDVPEGRSPERPRGCFGLFVCLAGCRRPPRPALAGLDRARRDQHGCRSAGAPSSSSRTKLAVW